MKLHGSNLIIYEDGVATAASKSCEVEVSASTKKVSSPATGEWEESRKTGKRWNVSCSGLVYLNEYDVPQSMRDYISKVGATVRLSLQIAGSGEAVSGDAICKQFRVTATHMQLAQGSFSYEGSGPLE